MSFQNARIKAVGVNPADYHTRTAKRGTPEFVVSSSSLRAFWGCPSKWVEPIVAPDGTVSYWEFAGSKSTEWGNLFDTLLLTPEQFESRYAVRPSNYTATINQCPSCESVSDAKTCRACKCERHEVEVEKPWSGNAKACQEWADEQEKAGKTAVSEDDMFRVRQAIKRFLREPEFQTWMDTSDKQVWVTAEWHDPKTGLVIPCQCLMDLASREGTEFHKSLADVKTTKNAKVIPWEKWCHAAGYDIQAAWNTDLFVAATGREILNFCFLLSENEAPYQVGKRMMSQDIIDPKGDQGDIASGRRQYERMLSDYCQCLKSGRWPGYDDHDESAQGWTIVRPNPYQEQARLFSPKFDFEVEEAEPEMSDDPIP